MAYTKYSLTPANNNATPPDGAPEGMLPSAVNDTMRDMMAQIRDVGDGIRNGTYTMTAPVITGGSITGVALSGNTFTNPVITGGSINNTPIGASTANTGAFTTLSASGAFSANGGATLGDASGDALTINSSAVSIPNGLTFNSGAVTLSSNPTLSAGTANGVLYLNGSKVATSGTLLTFDGTNLGLGGFADPASGTSVGIYNNTTARLALRNNTTGNTSADGFEIAVTSTNVFISNKENGYTAFENNGTERMRIDSSGNVGIGMTPSAWTAGRTAIQMSGSSTAVYFAGGTTNTVFSNNTYFNSGDKFTNATGWAQQYQQQSDGTHAWFTSSAASGGAGATATMTERMRITSGGLVGIGTTAPQERLDVNGKIKSPTFYGGQIVTCAVVNTWYKVQDGYFGLYVFRDASAGGNAALLYDGSTGATIFSSSIANFEGRNNAGNLEVRVTANAPRTLYWACLSTVSS